MSKQSKRIWYAIPCHSAIFSLHIRHYVTFALFNGEIWTLIKIGDILWKSEPLKIVIQFTTQLDCRVPSGTVSTGLLHCCRTVGLELTARVSERPRRRQKQF